MLGAYLLIAIGLVFLGRNTGLIREDIWTVIWRFWPVILVLIGLSLLTKKTKVVGYVVGVLIILGLIFIGWRVAGQNNWHWSELGGATKGSNITLDEPLSSDVELVDLSVKLGAQDITFSDLSSGLVTGQFFTAVGEPQYKVEVEDKTAKVSVWQTRGWLAWPFNRNKTTTQSRLYLTNQVPVNLDFDLGASSVALDLSNLKVKSLAMETGALSGQVTLGSQESEVKADIDMGASKVDFRVPKSCGLLVEKQVGLSSVNYRNLSMATESDKVDRSQNYTSAPCKIDMKIDAGASTLSFIGY